MVRSSLGVPNMLPAKPDDLLTRPELAARLGVRPTTIARWSRTGRIPARCLSPKVVRYDLAAVLAALEARHEAAGREVKHGACPPPRGRHEPHKPHAGRRRRAPAPHGLP